MNTGHRIKHLREKLGMTQTELGDAVGTTKQTIYKYETGVVTNIPLDRLGRIADALETTPGYLMGWTDNYYNYDTDPDNRFTDIPRDWLDHWYSMGLSNQEIWKRYLAVEDDMAAESDKLAEKDAELTEYLEVLRSRPECRMLFSLAKDATKADVEKAVAIIEALRGIGDK